MRVTLADIARSLGVSESTVSRALNDNPRVSRQTRMRVKAAAEEMGYIRDEIAKCLRVRQTEVLGFITGGFTSSYPNDILQGVETTASRMGYSVIVGTSRADPQVERRLITAFLGRKVDGIVVSPVVSDENVDLYNWLLARGFPIIFVDRHLPEVKCSYITTDNYKGALLGVLHLIDQGYRRIVCLAGTEAHCFEVQERVRGYTDALDQHGLSYRYIQGDQSIDECPTHVFYGYHYTLNLLKSAEMPDAIFAINDEIALGALRACVEAGLRVPEDIGIIGFDNVMLDAYLPISLSSIHQPKSEMGIAAANWVISAAKGPHHDVIEQLLTPTLVVRESTLRKGLNQSR